jgi:hypothetical protein
MNEHRKTTVRISPAAARYVQPDTTREDRLNAASGKAPLPSSDVAVVQFCLSRDRDPEVRAAAIAGLREIPEGVLHEITGSPDTHPRFLELLARLHGLNPAVAERISLNPAADEPTLSYLAEQGSGGAVVLPETPSGECPADTSSEQDPAAERGAEDEDEQPAEEEEEAFRTNFQLAKEMTVSEKIKLALTGDKEWRMLLIKDINKLVSGSVIKNPRITEAEILLISKSHLNNDDILRDICINKDWTKNYQIKKSLVENHKTPLHFALRFLSGLTDKDLGVLAKSKNVSSVISTQARRMLLNKQKEK